MAYSDSSPARRCRMGAGGLGVEFIPVASGCSSPRARGALFAASADAGLVEVLLWILAGVSPDLAEDVREGDDLGRGRFRGRFHGLGLGRCVRLRFECGIGGHGYTSG